MQLTNKYNLQPIPKAVGGPAKLKKDIAKSFPKIRSTLFIGNSGKARSTTLTLTLSDCR